MRPPPVIWALPPHALWAMGDRPKHSPPLVDTPGIDGKKNKGQPWRPSVWPSMALRSGWVHHFVPYTLKDGIKEELIAHWFRGSKAFF